VQYIGIDLSISSTGIVVLDGNTTEPLLAEAILSKKPDRGDLDRFIDIAERISDKIGSVRVVGEIALFVLMENMAFGAKGQLTRLAELRGIVQYQLLKNLHIRVLYASIQTLKKYAAGRGAGKGKGPVMVGCYKSWGFETQCDDIADAYVLAQMAKELDYFIFNRKVNQELPKYRQECIETIRKGNKIKK
jgi:hypothetical protein